MNISRIEHYKRSVATIKDIPALLQNNDTIYGYFQHQTNTNYTELIGLLSTKGKLPEIIPVINLADEYSRSCWGI